MPPKRKPTVSKKEKAARKLQKFLKKHKKEFQEFLKENEKELQEFVIVPKLTPGDQFRTKLLEHKHQGKNPHSQNECSMMGGKMKKRSMKKRSMKKRSMKKRGMKKRSMKKRSMKKRSMKKRK